MEVVGMPLHLTLNQTQPDFFDFSAISKIKGITYATEKGRSNINAHKLITVNKC